MKRFLVIAAVLLVAAAAVGGLMYSGWFNRERSDRIQVSGNIELNQVEIAFKVPGKLVERTVDEGDPVRKGMLLARLDAEQTEGQKQRDEAILRAAESQLGQLKTAISMQRETLAGEIALREAELRQAQARLDELTAGSRRQEILQAEAVVAEARSRHTQAVSDWERARGLYKSDDISRMQYDQHKAGLDATAAVLRRAQEQLALVKEGPRQEHLDAARAQVERARAALRLAEATKYELRRKEEEQGARQAEIDRARAQLRITSSLLGDMEAYSPIDGMVLVESAEPGEVLAAGATVMTVGDLDHPWLRAYIGQRDLGRVKTGARVRLRTDSFPGKDYWGRVSFIASEAEFTPKQIQTNDERLKLVYRIKIDADNPRHELKSNMPVDAEILLEQR